MLVPALTLLLAHATYVLFTYMYREGFYLKHIFINI